MFVCCMCLDFVWVWCCKRTHIDWAAKDWPLWCFGLEEVNDETGEGEYGVIVLLFDVFPVVLLGKKEFKARGIGTYDGC